MRMPWLDPDERDDLIGRLIHYELLQWDNRRNLPLKSGGKTDIYVKLRDARNRPDAIRALARIYANPLRRLNIARFAEVPDSVSCFAGHLSAKTGIPYLTICEEAKEGRVAKARVIGEAKRGERVALLDDVVTDGASKVEPYRECLRMGLQVPALIVLVDREQGWRQKFAAENVRLDVWPGMTLHDIRRRLVEMGAMERSDPTVEAMNPIIVALDGKPWEEVLPLVDELRTTGCTWKVNDMVFNGGIANIVPNLQTYGRVMVDLKCHDIPNTVANTCLHLRAHKPWAVTVHASGGEEMVSAAVQALAGTGTNVLAITVLTSLKDECEDIFQRQPLSQVVKLAEIANKAGAHGFVCSPEEAAVLRKLYPESLIVTPGIRSAGVDKGDQARVDTPAAAIAKGANRIVMGRQILGAKDPVAEVKRVLDEEIHPRC